MDIDKRKNQQIDVGLSVLVNVAPPGTSLSQREIAEVCGCSASMIRNIEKGALKKLRIRARHLKDYLG